MQHQSDGMQHQASQLEGRPGALPNPIADPIANTLAGATQNSMPGSMPYSAPHRPPWQAATEDRVGQANQVLPMRFGTSPMDRSEALHGSRSRLETALPLPGHGLAALIHDTRNMVASIELYSDLLEDPGVLSAPFRHYAGELRLIAGASRRLLDTLRMVDCLGALGSQDPVAREFLQSIRGFQGHPDNPSAQPQRDPLFSSPAAFPPGSVSGPGPEPRPARDARPGNISGMSHAANSPQPSNPSSIRPSPRQPSRRQTFLDGQPVVNLAEELRANHRLLSALAGPGITVGLDLSGGHAPVAMTADDLTRVLVNLARNAADAMPGGGHIQISLDETPDHLRLTFADSGAGIPESALEAIFTPGFTTRVPQGNELAMDGWPSGHRGLGLSIVRSLVHAVGGRIHAANLSGAQSRDTDCEEVPPTGAIIEIQFPRIPALQAGHHPAKVFHPESPPGSSAQS